MKVSFCSGDVLQNGVLKLATSHVVDAAGAPIRVMSCLATAISSPAGFT
jgi:hypothetical protein